MLTLRINKQQLEKLTAPTIRGQNQFREVAMKHVVNFMMIILFFSLLVSGCSSVPQKSREEIAAENLKKANKFLSDNKSNPDIKESLSGLQYKILKKGTGRKPNLYSEVHVRFVGKLLGEEMSFDYSDPNKPAVKVAMAAVIRGWREGISLMREGSSYMFFIPPHLAYGEKGSKTTNKTIGPNQLLIYTINLEKVDYR